jgi:hypothetical protein
MRRQQLRYNQIYIIAIICVLSFIIYYSTESAESFETSIQTRTLAGDGFCVLQNELYANNTLDIPCPELRRDVLNCLPEGYEFIDYVYKIKDVALSTFHRDVTSSQRIYKTTHPVYTVILYKYEGDLLSLCPNSHETYPFVLSRIVTVNGTPGTTFIFDCDVLHAGCVNNCKRRELIQYKVCHRDDLSKLSTLVGTRVDKKGVCKVKYYDTVMRKLTYFFEFPINYIFYPLMIKRENANNIVGKIQSYIPIDFYNNSK